MVAHSGVDLAKFVLEDFVAIVTEISLAVTLPLVGVTQLKDGFF